MMTQDELRALGERWKACPGFRWRPGMVDQHRRRVVIVPADYGINSNAAIVVFDREKGLPCGVYTDSLWPLLSCPATRGWPLEDVRKALGYDVTLIAALEAAPR